MLELEQGGTFSGGASSGADAGTGAATGVAPGVATGGAAHGERPLLRRVPDSAADAAPDSADAAADAAGAGARGPAGENIADESAAQAEAVRQSHWQDFVRQQQAQHGQEVQLWRRMTADDPEIGGDRLSVSVARAQWALNRFDPDRVLGQWMEESGLGNHPEVIRFFNRLADAVGDDVVVQGRVAREMPSLEERMYPNWNV